MPTPLPSEDKEEFIDRCMVDPESMQDFEDLDQRLAFCENIWDEAGEENSRAKPSVEHRVVKATNLEIRADDNGKKTLRGYAAVFNSLSENLGGFREQISPGAFAASIVEGADIKAFWNHNSDIVLGRTTSGTLRLREDDVGLAIEIDPPASAASFIESVQRGDVDQMSFGFSVEPDGDRVDVDNDGMVIRTLKNVRLFEVSPVAMPAYPATSISARTLEDLQRRAKPKMQEQSEEQARRIRMKRKLLDAKKPKTSKVNTHV